MGDLEREIKHLIVEATDIEGLKVEDIDSDLPLFEEGGLGLDSIDAMELGIALRKRYKVTLQANDAGNREHFRSVRTLAVFVAASRQD
jgi:acyl carrier protein